MNEFSAYFGKQFLQRIFNNDVPPFFRRIQANAFWIVGSIWALYSTLYWIETNLYVSMKWELPLWLPFLKDQVRQIATLLSAAGFGQVVTAQATLSQATPPLADSVKSADQIAREQLEEKNAILQAKVDQMERDKNALYEQQTALPAQAIANVTPIDQVIGRGTV